MGEALKYPFQDESWVMKILIGGLLTIASILIVPLFFVMGYQLRAMKTGMDNESDLPEFSEWGDMFLTGLAGVFIAMAYPLLAVPFWVLAGFFGSTLSGLLFLIGFLVLLFALYLVPAGFANYMQEGYFTAGFDSDIILSVATRSEYFVSWILAIVIGLVGSAIAGPLNVILVGIFFQFYINICIFYLLGQGFNEALQT